MIDRKSEEKQIRSLYPMPYGDLIDPGSLINNKSGEGW